MNLCLKVIIIAILVGWSSVAPAENWPQWRGPTGDGISREKNLPVAWSATDNILWKTPLKGKGSSTPILWGDRIFLTLQTGKGPVGKGPQAGGLNEGPVENSDNFNVHLWTMGFDRKDGKQLWEHEIKPESLIPTQSKHNLASPSCVTDGEHVYSWFGTGQLACFDFDGKVIWERDLAKDYEPFVIIWGHGSSPALYGDSLILLCDHTRASYILAVDKKTGKNLWRLDRGKGGRSYSTPLFINADGRDQMIVNTAGRVESLNPKDGSLIWKAAGILQVPVPSPIVADHTVFTYGGWSSGPILAVKLGGEGDVTASNVLWSKKNGGPYVPSLVTQDGLLYMINDGGVGTCFDSKTGDVIWKERIGGNFSSSPVLADGKIYATNEDGETVVLATGREFKIRSRNTVDEFTLASVAVSDGKIYFRTEKHLYCVGK